MPNTLTTSPAPTAACPLALARRLAQPEQPTTPPTAGFLAGALPALRDAEASPSATLILGTMEAGGAIVHTRCDNPRDLIHIAGLLLDEAHERLSADDPEDDDTLDILDAIEDARDALAGLPDEDADGEAA